MKKKFFKKTKRLLKKIDLKWFAIILLVIILIGQSFYFYRKLNSFNTKLNSEITKNFETKDQLDALQDATSYFYKNYQETGEWTIVTLVETVESLEEWQDYIDDFVETHNENVEIYNGNFDGIWADLDSLERRVNAIVNYLR